MIKHFCDVCGKEVDRNYVSNRLARKDGKVQVEVIVAINGAWNNGDICLPCLMHVINDGEPTRRRNQFDLGIELIKRS